MILKSYLQILLSSFRAGVATEKRVSAEATIKCGTTSRSSKTPLHKNLTIPCFSCSRYSAFLFSKFTRLKEYVDIPGGGSTESATFTLKFYL